MNDQLGQRLVYNNCVAALLNAGFTQAEVDASFLTQSYLRLEQFIGSGGAFAAATSTNNQFNFPVLINATNNGQSVRATEQRLSLQDGFYVSGFMLYLAKPSSSTTGAFPLYTYPNLVAFPNGAANLEAVYNGSLNVQINQKNIITTYPLQRSKQLRQTQQTAAAASGFPQDQYDGTFDQPIEPNMLILGSNNTSINVILPQSVGTIDAGTLMVLVFNGIKAQNISTLVQ
jgi:archaellum component FlaF (FlaF/FlaG flagellin family)